MPTLGDSYPCGRIGCDQVIVVETGTPGRRRLYHDPACKLKAQHARQTAKRRGLKLAESEAQAEARIKQSSPERVTTIDERGIETYTSARRGPLYDKFRRTGVHERIAAGEISASEAAEILANLDPQFARTRRQHVSQWMASIKEDDHRARLTAMHRVEGSAAHLLEDFPAFRAAYFETIVYDSAMDVAPEPQPYLTPEFHQVWVDSILDTMRRGGRLMILSPPRHGKTDLLTHFAAWMIMRNPNIRILWVGGNEDIAKQSVYAVRTLLEENEKLRAAYAPEGTFHPGKAQPWTDEKFTVATRTVAQKSPTMRAVGRGTKVLSRDCDLIIVDDIIDQKAIVNPENRVKDADWVRTQIGSRKMAHTAVVVIGSRQHPDDLYNDLLENPAWRSIVESAHDPACPINPDDADAHVDCVLFPELNPYWHLREQMDDFGPARFSMVYQNDPADAGVRVFDAPTLEGTKNFNRRVGDLNYMVTNGTPIGALPLVAGIDPASAGVQACFLWAVHPESKTRLMLDMEAEMAGGIDGFLRVMKMWYEKYLCDQWVLESNAHQAMWMSTEVRDYAYANGISVHMKDTRGDKSDPDLGVTHHAVLMGQDSPLPHATKRIDIPWAPDAETRRKADKVIRGYLSYEGNVGRKRGRTDIVMSAWIPEQRIRGLLRLHTRRRDPRRGQVTYTFSPVPGIPNVIRP